YPRRQRAARADGPPAHRAGVRRRGALVSGPTLSRLPVLPMLQSVAFHTSSHSLGRANVKKCERRPIGAWAALGAGIRSARLPVPLGAEHPLDALEAHQRVLHVVDADT